jgi:hypothetical protein
MPLAGAASDKLGNRYEDKWTVYCLGQVMAEEADEIRLVPPGSEGDGCEFWLKRGKITEYHQVKRQRATPGAWTIADLSYVGVLAAAFQKTREPNSRFVFVSALSANQLDRLVEAAKAAQSYDELLQSFAASGFPGTAWNTLLDKWRPLIRDELAFTPSPFPEREAAGRTAFERLRRIDVRTIDETSLTEKASVMLRTLIRDVPDDTVRVELTAFALENVHRTLDARTLWDWASGRGYVRADYAKDATVLAAVDRQNNRYAEKIDSIAGTITLPREEARQAFETLTGGASKTSVLISGGAGIGKSGILAQTVRLLRDAGIPYLYFRVDELRPTLLPAEVGQQLGLPRSPAEIIANVARFRQSILVIDQLDDVGTASGRHRDLFRCISEIAQQARALPGVRLLLACRRFDLQKDSQLRELATASGTAREIEAAPFSVDEVSSILRRLGQDPATFDPDQIELLRVPLHLSLFAQVAHDAAGRVPTLTRKVDLFNAYWERKLQQATERLRERPCQWNEVVDRLCERMTDERSLFVDETALDDYDATCRAMLTEHVLIASGRRIGFFHASFFDYVFARRFVAKGRDLLDYLRQDEQALFKRPVLRQIVLYGVERNTARFARAIRGLLLDPDVRFHLKHCALDAIQQTEMANTLVWGVLQDVLAGDDPALARAAENLLAASGAWFTFLHDGGHLETWLSSEEAPLRDRGLRCVIQQTGRFPDESAFLLSPHVGESPEWNTWILRALGGRELVKSRALFDVFLALVGLDALPAGSSPSFWTYLYPICDGRPDWAAQAIGAYLARQLLSWATQELKEKLLDKSVHGEEVIPDVAAKAPSEFLAGVLPFFLDVVKKTTTHRNDTLLVDPVWGWRSYDSVLCLKDAVLRGLENALCKMANGAPGQFAPYYQLLADSGDYDSANFLVMRAFSVVDGSFADRAVEYMLENLQRLESGWSLSADAACAQYWAGRQAIQHISSLCSDENFRKLEQAVLDHYPSWERSEAGRRAYGRWQLIMLTALEPGRRSQVADARIGELERKFPDARISAPVPIRVQAVESPIPDSATQKMSDDNWLRAISKYNQEDREHWGEDHRLRGGAAELSRQLEAASENDPVRFARLAGSFTAETNPYYFNAVLIGLSKANAPKQVVFDVVRHFFGLAGRPGGRWMSSAIVKYSAEEIPEDILSIVGLLATEAADPESDDEAETWSQDSIEAERPGDYLNRAINTTRGAAAEAIGFLVYANAERVPLFLPYLERAVADPTVTVRTAAVHGLCGLFAHDERCAVDLFLRLCEGVTDLLLATHHVDRFLYHGDLRHFAQLRGIVERMLGSSLAVVREAGARHACLAQFSAPEAADLAAACVLGDESQRKGAAAVAQANAFNPACREFSHSTLVRFFNDASEDVRDEASRCFLRAKHAELGTDRNLVREFLTSKSFAEHGEYLVRALKASTADLSDVIAEVCEAVLGVLEAPSSTPYGRLFFEAQDLADLVFRAYSQSQDPDLRARCLDMVDGFLRVQAYGVEKQLAAYER